MVLVLALLNVLGVFDGERTPYDWIVIVGFNVLIDALITWSMFTTCHTWIMDEKGCTFVLLKRKRTYTWEQLKTRWVIKKSIGSEYEECLFLSTHTVKKVKNGFFKGERYLENWHSWHPETVFYAWLLTPEKRKGTNLEYVAEDVDKKELFEKLESWGVERERIKWQLYSGENKQGAPEGLIFIKNGWLSVVIYVVCMRCKSNIHQPFLLNGKTGERKQKRWKKKEGEGYEADISYGQRYSRKRRRRFVWRLGRGIADLDSIHGNRLVYRRDYSPGNL